MPEVMELRTEAETSRETTKRPGSYWLWAGAISFLYCLLAWGNALVALPWCDEAWLSNPALTYLRKGYLGTPILTWFGWGPPESLLHIEHRTYWIMPLHMIAQIGWYKLFGFSLLSVRTLSIFWGAIGILALGSIVLHLVGRPAVALGAMLIAATDYFYLTRAADGRMDMMAAGLLLAAIAVYLHLRERHLRWAALVGGTLAAGCAFTHPIGGFFVLVGIGFLALRYDRRRIGFAHLALFALPFLAIGVCWAAYIAQDPAAFRQQIAGNAAGRWEGITNPVMSIYREFRFKYLQAFGFNDLTRPTLHDLRLLALCAYLAAFAAVAWKREPRRSPGIRTLVGITGVFVVGGLAFDGAKRWYYLVYVVPFLCALLAVWIDILWTERPLRRPLLSAAILLFFSIQIGGTAYRIYKNDYRQHWLPAARWVEQHDREHAPILGTGELGFELGFPSYLKDDVSLGYFTGVKPKLIFVADAYWGLWLNTLLERKPEVGQWVARTLHDDYHLAYRDAPYRIYERNEWPVVEAGAPGDRTALAGTAARERIVR